MKLSQMRFRTRAIIGSLLGAVIISVALFGPHGILQDVHAQTRTNAINLDKQGKFVAEIGAQVYWSPADLGFNAIVLPASAATGTSAPVNTKGAKEIVFYVACTQVASLTLNAIDLDGATVLYSQSVMTAIPTTGGLFAMGNESPSNVVGGTAVAGAAGVRSPVPFVSFSMTNAGATPGTCSARVIAQY